MPRTRDHCSSRIMQILKGKIESAAKKVAILYVGYAECIDCCKFDSKERRSQQGKVLKMNK